MKNTLLSLSLTLLAGAAFGQTVTYSGSVRVRQEAWDWFQPAGTFQNAYTFTGTTLRYGATRSTKTDDYTLELQASGLFSLPTRATAGAPQGGLGLGSLYRTFNGNQNVGLFTKQAFYRDKRYGTRVGRFDFNEGLETAPASPTLAWLKSQRVSQRLIGTFGWSHVGRSFDGVHYTKTKGTDNVTGVLAYPTRGVFDLDGASTLTSVRMGYVAATRTTKTTDSRVFGIQYEDVRQGVTKVDNRASTAGDKAAIRLTTLGGNYAKTEGEFDFLAWAAIQTGDWGQLDQQAYAYSLEVGWQPKGQKSAPWLRAGYDVYSGDSNGADGKHKTFYPLLNTPRIYARAPFFAEANSRDLFVQAILRPDKATTLRADFHRVSLDSAADRWYAAGGPFESTGSFGLIGRGNPSGKTNLADLIDISAGRTINKRTSASAYIGYLLGRDVVKGIYPDKDGFFVYGEVSYKL